MKTIKIDELNRIIAEVEEEHPYKQSGNRDSYSSYNEGWSDALGTLQGKIEAIKAEESKSIDRVTVDRLDAALRLCYIQIDKAILDRVIDVVELLEEKGGETSLEDICDLQSQWKGKCT